MTILQTVAGFLKGAYTKAGTSANLLREVSVSVLSAVSVAILVQILSPAPPDVVTELKAVLERQHAADSLYFRNLFLNQPKSTGGYSTAPASTNGINSQRR